MFVSSPDNPADILSRGSDAKSLKDNKLYWHGPSWITQPFDNFTSAEDLQKKCKKQTISLLTTSIPDNALSILNLDKDSNYFKLQRMVAYLMKFVEYLIKRNFKPQVTVPDLIKAEKWIIRAHQEEAYKQELAYLRDPKNKKKPRLLKTSHVFLDDEGFLRLATRLGKSSLSASAKQPLLLHKEHIVTQIIINSIHRHYNHPGPQQTLVLLRQKFWVPGGHSTVKRLVRNCITCTKVIGQAGKLPPRPSLPFDRVNPLRPLSSLAVDHTGHFMVTIKQEQVKVFLLIISCAATRYINIEVSFSMSTQGFLSALQRHFGVYGVPHTIYLDNYPSYIAAGQELQQLYQITRSETFNNNLSQQGIRFKHMPVLSPATGGVYESMVKIFKIGLKKAIGRRLLDFEDFMAVCRSIQGSVNSRPLYALRSNDLVAITPAHLVFGHPIEELPSWDVPDSDDEDYFPNPLPLVKETLQLRQKIKNEFIDIFLNNYLQILTEKHTSKTNKNNFSGTLLKVGQLCLLHNDNSKRLLWPLGIITKLHISQEDQKVRSVELRTTNGHTSRAVNRIYPLELSVDSFEAGLQEPNEDSTEETSSTKRPTRQASAAARKLIQDQLQILSGPEDVAVS